MQTFTLFTIPQAFENQYDLMQWNAIKSWTLLNPKPDIFLLGNAPGIASIANELGLYHLPNVDQNSSISEIAKWLDRIINNTILVYLNPSVILTADFALTIQEVYNNQEHFLLTGQYRTIQTEGIIDFNDSQWQHQLRVMADKQVVSQGQLQNIYLVLTKHLLKQLLRLDPNVESIWEQQLFYAALRKYYPIFDGSPIITAFLQIPKHSKWKVVDGLIIEGVPPDFELPPIVGENNDYTFIEEKRQAFIASAQPYKLGVSIIIPVYNRQTILAKTLAAITHQTYPASLIEVIVADDGSHDGVEKVIQKYKKHLTLKYVRQDDQGYRLSAVRNLGTRFAKYDYIAILDCDMLPTPKYIELLMQYFHVTDKAALMGQRRFVCTDNITDDQILENINVALALPDVMPSDECDRPEKEGEPIVDHRLKGYKKDNDLKSSLFSFYAFYGCSMAYPKKVIAEVGPFDEDFQAWGCEDIEMGYRIYNAGYYFIPVLEAIGLHQEPPDGENETDRSEGRQVTKDLLIQKCPAPVFRQYQPDVIYEVPKVSIYIPAYNAEKYIKAAVDSALAQTYTDFEICIVNDGSTDNTLQILEQNYQRNPRVRWINKKNGGTSNASNVAVKMCRGLYIGQLDADDILLRPDAVKIMVDYLDTHNVGGVYSSCNMIDEAGKYIEKGYEWPQFYREKLMDSMVVSHFRMYRKRDWMRTSGFDESMASSEDFDLFLKLSEITSLHHIRKILYGYRWHGENTSIVGSEKQIKYHKIAIEKALTRTGMDKEWETHVPDPKMPRYIVFKRTAENARIACEYLGREDGQLVSEPLYDLDKAWELCPEPSEQRADLAIWQQAEPESMGKHSSEKSEASRILTAAQNKSYDIVTKQERTSYTLLETVHHVMSMVKERFKTTNQPSYEEIVNYILERLSEKFKLSSEEQYRAIPLFVKHYANEKFTFLLAAKLTLQQNKNEEAFSYIQKAFTVNSLDLYTQSLFNKIRLSLNLSGWSKEDEEDLSKRFCTWPFNRIETRANNDVFFCCPAWLNMPIGNMNNDSLEQMWNSEIAQKIRISILDGSFKYCSRINCQKIVSKNLPFKTNINSSFVQGVIDNQMVIIPPKFQEIKLNHDDSCNLACPSCRSTLHVAKGETIKRLSKIADTIVLPMLKNARIVGISGQGDPFASKHYRYIMKKINAQAFPNLKIDLFTNGVLFDEESWNQLELNGLCRDAEISIDATIEETYNILRKGGDFKRLIKNLAFISNLRKKGELRQVRLIFIVQKENFLQIPDFIKLTKQFCFDNASFSMILPWSQSKKEYEDKNIGSSEHPLHEYFLQVLRDSLLRDEIVSLGTLKVFYDEALQTLPRQE